MGPTGGAADGGLGAAVQGADEIVAALGSDLPVELHGAGTGHTGGEPAALAIGNVPALQSVTAVHALVHHWYPSSGTGGGEAHAGGIESLQASELGIRRHVSGHGPRCGPGKVRCLPGNVCGLAWRVSSIISF